MITRSFVTGHSRYVHFIKNNFRANRRWLDAGGGHQIFHDEYDGERQLVERSRIVVACDRHEPSLKNHISVTNRICCDLSHLPMAPASFDVVTLAMVAEHLSEPLRCFEELARVIDSGGELILHTVNSTGYPTLLAKFAKLLPFRLRLRLIAVMTGRREEDIFPAYYRCNSKKAIDALLRKVGLTMLSCDYYAAGPLFRKVPPLFVIELLFIWLTLLPCMRMLRAQILVVATKA